jgi:hypothetical protein
VQTRIVNEVLMPQSIRKMIFTGLSLALMASIPITSVAAEKPQQPKLNPTSTGYAPAAEGLRVYYAIYGKGEPIVVMAGGFGDVTSMAQTIGPLSRERQVIGVELEGHGHTALRKRR